MAPFHTGDRVEIYYVGAHPSEAGTVIERPDTDTRISEYVPVQPDDVDGWTWIHESRLTRVNAWHPGGVMAPGEMPSTGPQELLSEAQHEELKRRLNEPERAPRDDEFASGGTMPPLSREQLEDDGFFLIEPFEEPTPRESVLWEAADLITGDRNKTYGSPTQNFSDTAKVWTVLLRPKLAEGQEIDPGDVAALMVALKLARRTAQAKRDTWTDIAGYAGCGYEADLNSGRIEEAE